MRLRSGVIGMMREKEKAGKPYVVAQDTKSGAYYCHMRGYPNIPVFGSIGDKRKANRVCKEYNRSVGASE